MSFNALKELDFSVIVYQLNGVIVRDDFKLIKTLF